MHEPRLTGKKRCKKCRDEFPVICFAANSECRDGLQNSCRMCQSEADKKRSREQRWRKPKSNTLRRRPSAHVSVEQLLDADL